MTDKIEPSNDATATITIRGEAIQWSPDEIEQMILFTRGDLTEMLVDAKVNYPQLYKLLTAPLWED
jgi:hypothetical protein